MRTGAPSGIRPSWRALALVALLLAQSSALCACTQGGDRSNPAEGWTPEEGFVRSWQR